MHFQKNIDTLKQTNTLHKNVIQRQKILQDILSTHIVRYILEQNYFCFSQNLNQSLIRCIYILQLKFVFI